MMSKKVAAFLILFLVQSSISKPTTDGDLSEGRGIGSTIWGWLTYPFTWWSAVEPEQTLAPVKDYLEGSITYVPENVVDTNKFNLDIKCDDQTCTTIKCNTNGCKNVTCNIYDTDMTGECREYNTIKPDEHITKPTNLTKPLQEIVPDKIKPPGPMSVTSTTSTEKESNIESDTAAEERPLELEAVLSSTVTGNETPDTSIAGAPKP